MLPLTPPRSQLLLLALLSACHGSPGGAKDDTEEIVVSPGDSSPDTGPDSQGTDDTGADSTPDSGPDSTDSTDSAPDTDTAAGDVRGATLPCAWDGTGELVVHLPGGTTATPLVLDQAGATYVLDADLYADNTAFTVAAADVTLDLDCHVVEYDRVPREGSCLSYVTAATVTGNLCHYGVARGKSWRPGIFPDMTDPETQLQGSGSFTVRNGTLRQGASLGSESSAIRNWDVGALTVSNMVLEVSGDDTEAIDVYADGVTIEHTTVLNHSTVVGNRHQHRASFHVYADVLSSVAIRQNRVEGGPQYGIDLSGGSSAAGASLVVEDNYVAQEAVVTNGYAIGAYADGMLVAGNELRPIKGRGIHVGGDSQVVRDNLVDVIEDQNPEYGCASIPVHGIKLEEASGADVYGNTVTARAGEGMCWAASALNLSLLAGQDNDVHDNVFTAQTDTEDLPAAALYVAEGDGSGSRIHDNVFSSNDVLVQWYWDGGTNYLFENNSFSFLDSSFPDFATPTLQLDNSLPVTATFRGSTTGDGVDLLDVGGCFECDWHGSWSITVE